MLEACVKGMREELQIRVWLHGLLGCPHTQNSRVLEWRLLASPASSLNALHTYALRIPQRTTSAPDPQALPTPRPPEQAFPGQAVLQGSPPASPLRKLPSFLSPAGLGAFFTVVPLPTSPAMGLTLLIDCAILFIPMVTHTSMPLPLA